MHEPTMIEHKTHKIENTKCLRKHYDLQGYLLHKTCKEINMLKHLQNLIFVIRTIEMCFLKSTC